MIIVSHIGKRGTAGRDGTNGFGVATQSGAKVGSPFTLTFAPNEISSEVTWSRNSEGTFQNRYNKQDTVLPAIVNQVIDYTKVDEINWFDPFGNDNWQVTGTGVTDPFGGTDAVEVTIGNTTPVGKRLTLVASPKGVKLNEVYTISFYAQLVSGTITGCTAGLSNISAATSIDISELDATWKRFSIRVSSIVTNEFNLYFQTTGAVINLYGINATEGITLQDVVSSEGTAPNEITTGSEVYRETKEGYIIQPESTNLCPYSEDYRQWSIVGVSSLIANEDFDSLEGSGSFTKFIVNGTTELFRQAADITPSTQYSVSFYAVAPQSTITDLSVSLGDGDAVSFSATQNYIRQTVKVTAGAGGDIKFTFTNVTAAATFVLAGIQIELSEPTGYIPTKNGKRTRASDNVSLTTSELPSLAQPFTIFAKWSNAYNNPLQKYLFNADDSFYAYAENAQFIVFGGGVELFRFTLDDVTNDEVFIVFDGVNAKAYSGGTERASALYAGESAKPAFFYIGSSDNSGTNSFNGTIKSLTFWNFAMTADETKHVGEK